MFDKSIREVVQECIRDEVESNMFDSLKTLEMISKKEGIDINRYENILEEFKEIYFRRNIYVHNEGKVNDKYISSVSEKYRKNVKNEDKLLTDDEYLKKSINVLYKVVGALFYEIQMQLDPKYEEWKHAFFSIAFKLLCNENYCVAQHFYYRLSKCQYSCFRDKTMSRINYITSLKQQGYEKNVKDELETLDVSIATENFKIAKMCLEDKNEEVYNALNKNYPDPYSAELVRDWPLFINFRKTEFYRKFVEEHAEDTNTIETTLLAND